MRHITALVLFFSFFCANLAFSQTNAVSVVSVSALGMASASAYPNGVWVNSYYGDGNIEPVFYTVQTSSCSPTADGGARIAMVGGCAYMNPRTIIDPRHWGAKADVQSFKTTTTVYASVSSSANTLTVQSTSLFTTADQKKYIAVTDISNAVATPSGITYSGKLLTVAVGASSTVITFDTSYNSPPTFNYSGMTAGAGQTITWGSDDSAAVNNAITYTGTLNNGGVASAFPLIDFGGGRYGFISPMLASANAEYRNGSIIALGVGGATSNFECNVGGVSPIGLVEVSAASRSAYNNLLIDLSYLPITGFETTKNGDTTSDRLSIRHWMGWCDPATSVATPTATTIPTGSQVIPLNDATTVIPFMVSHGNSSLGIPDRAMIVDIKTNTASGLPCPGVECVVISKPTTKPITTSTPINFYHDANGLVLRGQNAGMEISRTQLY